MNPSEDVVNIVNRTRAEFRAARAVELKLEGLSYDEIAGELGYSNRSGAWKAVRRCLRGRQALAAQLYVNVRRIDLDLIERGVWAKAMQGEIGASFVVLRAIDARIRLAEHLTAQETQGRKPRKLSPVAVVVAPAERWSRQSSGPETGFFRLDV